MALTLDELKILFEDWLDAVLDRTRPGALATWLLNHVDQAKLLEMLKALAQARKNDLTAAHQPYVDEMVAKCDEVLGM